MSDENSAALEATFETLALRRALNEIRNIAGSALHAYAAGAEATGGMRERAIRAIAESDASTDEQWVDVILRVILGELKDLAAQRGPNEDPWDCIQRLAPEVCWDWPRTTQPQEDVTDDVRTLRENLQGIESDRYRSEAYAALDRLVAALSREPGESR